MKKILVVGQVPPPISGQAMMIQTLLDGSYVNVELYHIRMSFSHEMDEMGKFKISKILHLIQLIYRIVHARFKFGTDILYYPPCGPDMLPMMRDIAVLCATRWMFKRTIFHFHAAGISEMAIKVPWYLRPFFKLSYDKPDLAIQLSPFNPDDGKCLHALKRSFVPNGIEDKYTSKGDKRGSGEEIVVLYVGLVSESKGILVLIEAVRHLVAEGLAVQVNVVGKFKSEEFRHTTMKRLEDFGLQNCFCFPGVLKGEAKWEQFRTADIFCFPSYFESESFGLVVAEAMQFQLPVVASRWRGIQSLVVNDQTGYLTTVKDSLEVAEKIILLAKDPEKRREMGAKGRARYLKEYSIEKFYTRMNDCFLEI